MIDEAKTGEEKTKQPIARRLPLNLSVNLNNKFHLGVKSLRRIFLFCFLSLFRQMIVDVICFSYVVEINLYSSMSDQT